MNDSTAQAFRILGRFWLEEVQTHDLAIITALPELAETLPDSNESTLDELAIEYQNLFGFNVPPYESVFVDPSAMLMAPATARVQALYRQAGWKPPADVRAGAADHIGLELLACADWQQRGQHEPAQRLLVEHLALWVPAFIGTLTRLDTHPFYATLADLTLNLILATLPDEPLPIDRDPFPDLPPPPVYRASGMPEPKPADEEDMSLNDLVTSLLTPRKAGLYITRQDIRCIGTAVDLPGVVGERERMLKTLFRLAGQYDALRELHRELSALLEDAGAAYAAWAADYPQWTAYAQAWRRRLNSAEDAIAELANFAIED